MTKEKDSFWETLERRDQKFQVEVLSIVANPRKRVSDFLRSSTLFATLLRAKDRHREKNEDLVGLDEPLSIDEYARMIDEKFLSDYSIAQVHE